MAYKKITAFRALDSTGKDPTDMLHIIDFSASPVYKKITLANLFARIDTPVSSVGTSNFEFGPTTAISAFKVDIPNATPAGGAESTVVVNENGNEFIDFRVESNNSAQAIFVDSSDDNSNYQTYFAKKEGAVASPTASLHFTKDVLNSLKKKGIIITPITLHVGAGTFLPVKSDKIKDHKMHYEWCEVNETTSKIVNNAKKNNKK